MISSRRISPFHTAVRLNSALPFVFSPVSSLSCVRTRTLSRLFERRDAMQFQRKRSGETRELAPFLSSVARSIACFEKAGTATSERLYRCLVLFSSACSFARPRPDSPTGPIVARGSLPRHRFEDQRSRECSANRWKVARSVRRCSYDGEAKRRRRRRRKGTRRWEMARGYYAEASCRQTECHIVDMYGQLKLLPLSSISLISVSIGVFPTSRTKNSCSITCDDTVLSEGNRRSSLPNLVG